MADPILPIRVDPAERDAWQAYCDEHKLTLSQLVRDSVRVQIGDTASMIEENARLRAALGRVNMAMLSIRNETDKALSDALDAARKTAKRKKRAG